MFQSNLCYRQYAYFIRNITIETYIHKAIIHEANINVVIHLVFILSTFFAIIETLFLLVYEIQLINIIETIIDILFLFDHDRLPIDIIETIKIVILFLFDERLLLFDHDDRLSNSNINMLLLLVHDDRFINNIAEPIDMLFLLVHDGILFLLAHDDSLTYFNSVIVREKMFKNRFAFRTFITYNVWIAIPIYA